jgi:hypothetical protein
MKVRCSVSAGGSTGGRRLAMTLRKHALLEIVMTIIAIALIWWWLEIPKSF